MMTMRYLNRFCILFSILLLTSCGFKFRGQLSANLEDVQIQLTAADSYSLLAMDLKRKLIRMGAKLNVSHINDHSPAISVYLGNISEARNTLSVDKNGRPVEYEFVLEVPVDIHLYQGEDDQNGDKSNLHIRRVLVYDNNLLLAKSSERDQVRKEMRHVLVAQIIERIRAYAS